jgi:outer membrane biosynthesis protein TonB
MIGAFKSIAEATDVNAQRVDFFTAEITKAVNDLVPEIPSKEILSRITYPPIALKQGIEGVVYLELFIDADGRGRNKGRPGRPFTKNTLHRYLSLFV